MSARALLLGAIITSLTSSCAISEQRATTSAPPANDFEATIARIERTDPTSPALLSARLGYADFLLSRAPGPCAQRLERAQELLGSVDASPETRVMFSDGWARVADLQYRLHSARSACGSDADRANELRSAVAAARHAVELYRDVYDYRSMVIMQFDAAVALRQLGDNAAALTALEASLDMDREYGFEDDARQNYQLLLSWRGEPAGAAQVTALMQDFPQRRAILKFAWHASDAQVTLERRRESLDNDQIIHSRAAATVERRIAADQSGGWSVSYARPLTWYDPGVWPLMQSSRTAPTAFVPDPLPWVGLKLSATGDFQGVTDSKAFATWLTTKTDELIRAGAPPGGPAHNTMSEAIEATAEALSPGVLEARTAENYQLETAMWIGATLEQGVWYQVAAPLSLPGMPQVVIQHRIDFVFTRTLPCTAAAVAQTCVEIVMRAAPDNKALDHVTADLGFKDYETSTEARLVTDPATLLPYAREEQVYWYASSGRGSGDAILQSQHLVSATRYRAYVLDAGGAPR
jgi:tetratricopeptide (TPR) repeat protein